MMVDGVKDGDQDDSDLPNNGADDGQGRKYLFTSPVVGLEAASMSQVTLRGEGEDVKHGLDSCTHNEESLEVCRSNIRKKARM